MCRLRHTNQRMSKLLMDSRGTIFFYPVHTYVTMKINCFLFSASEYSWFYYLCKIFFLAKLMLNLPIKSLHNLQESTQNKTKQKTIKARTTACLSCFRCSDKHFSVLSSFNIDTDNIMKWILVIFPFFQKEKNAAWKGKELCGFYWSVPHSIYSILFVMQLIL